MEWIDRNLAIRKNQSERSHKIEQGSADLWARIFEECKAAIDYYNKKIEGVVPFKPEIVDRQSDRFTICVMEYQYPLPPQRTSRSVTVRLNRKEETISARDVTLALDLDASGKACFTDPAGTPISPSEAAELFLFPLFFSDIQDNS